MTMNNKIKQIWTKIAQYFNEIINYSLLSRSRSELLSVIKYTTKKVKVLFSYNVGMTSAYSLVGGFIFF